jgi:hypothetical protein
MHDRGPSLPTSLAGRRLLSPEARARGRRDVVFQQLDDLNALLDPLRSRARDLRGRDAQRARARAISARVVRAARLVPATAVEQAWAYLAEPTRRPEDAFGPAILLLAIAADDPRVHHLVQGLPRELKAALRAIAALGPARRRARPPASR